MARYPASHYRAKAIIKACAAVGAGIECLEDAPHFRYYPRGQEPHWAGFPVPKPLPPPDGPPSKRNSVSCGRNPLKLRTWKPVNLDANPMYHVGMRGDCPELTKARKAWHDGDPTLLREYLANNRQADELQKAA